MRADVDAAPLSGTEKLAEFLVLALLGVGFFIAPMKMLGGGWFAYLLPDFLAASILLIVLGSRAQSGRSLLPRSRLTGAIVLLTCYLLLEFFNPESPAIRSVLGLRSWLLYMFLYFVGIDLIRSVRQVTRLYVWLLVLGIVTAAYGAVQWNAGPESFQQWSPAYAEYAVRMNWSVEEGVRFRAFSTFVAPGTFAGNMALLMSLALTVAASSRMSPLHRIFALGAFGVMGTGIAVSGSRAPVVHLVLMAVLLPLMFPRFWSGMGTGARVGAVAGGGLALVVWTVGPAVSERYETLLDVPGFVLTWFEYIRGSVEFALDYPIGAGLGFTAGVPTFLNDPLVTGFVTTTVDSGYGSAAVELGIPGLLLFLYFALRVGYEGARAWRRLPPGRLKDLLLAPALWAATYPLFSIIAQPQASLPSSIYFWLLIGVLMRVSERAAAPHEDRILRPALRA